MTGNFAISLLGRLAQVGRARSCAPAAVSATARPCHRGQIEGKFHPNGRLSGESRLNGSPESSSIATAATKKQAIPW
jgi:hypothetical protein